jgi:tetratricopeptide (TPR) repeat protein
VLTERFKSEDAIAARLQRARESVGTYNARYESERAIATEFAWLASLCERKEDFEAAISWYQRALDLDYRNVGWHLALARALAEMERWDDAIHEARICLRLRPHMASAEELIKRWCVRDPVAE